MTRRVLTRMNNKLQSDEIQIRYFDWQDWPALWQLRSQQLAANGIIITSLPSQPDLSSPYEQDYHRIDQVYLRGAGGFWIAWDGETPVGHVGAQDLGGVVELRRTYVHAGYRRQGVGKRLVRALIQHCNTRAVTAIELWTAETGPGRSLYSKLGFGIVDGPSEEFGDAPIPADEAPDAEIRMRLDLGDASTSWRRKI